MMSDADRQPASLNSRLAGFCRSRGGVAQGGSPSIRSQPHTPACDERSHAVDRGSIRRHSVAAAARGRIIRRETFGRAPDAAGSLKCADFRRRPRGWNWNPLPQDQGPRIPRERIAPNGSPWGNEADR